MGIKTAILAVSLLAACQTSKVAPAANSGINLTTRNNCYSLLHQLLGQESDVSLLRFIKHENTDVKDVVTRIAATSKTGDALLREYARQDPSLALDDTALPPGEVATRQAIAAAKQKTLLHPVGDEFELTLLLSQAQALSYGANLAKVAAENESRPDHARGLLGVSDDLQKLYDEVFALMLARMGRPPPPTGR